jgi:hypothetical protein
MDPGGHGRAPVRKCSSDPSWSEVCPCHGERTHYYKDSRYRGGGYWRCPLDRRERSKRHYEALTNRQYNKRLLDQRRSKALIRIRERAERSLSGTL